jgi:hypothetical protein
MTVSGVAKVISRSKLPLASGIVPTVKAECISASCCFCPPGCFSVMTKPASDFFVEVWVAPDGFPSVLMTGA